MLGHFTLRYRLDDGWCVGQWKEVPGVFAQGETLALIPRSFATDLSCPDALAGG